jgi:hypothetical protein
LLTSPFHFVHYIGSGTGAGKQPLKARGSKFLEAFSALEKSPRPAEGLLLGTERRLAALHKFGRFQSKADIARMARASRSVENDRFLPFDHQFWRDAQPAHGSHDELDTVT